MAKGKKLFNTTHSGANTQIVRMDIPSNSEWEQRFLLRSDAHHDNPKCRQELEKEHLDLAVEYNAGIIDCGDLFCAMQGKWDKRSSKDAVRPEHQTANYLDALVDTAADFYQPYAHHWLLMGRGNHETAIKKKHETDLTERLVAVINNRTKSTIQASGYTGWVRFQFKRGQEQHSRVLWFTHGYGGGGPVTQDAIQANRQHVYIENADIMLSGHVHRSWTQEFIKIKMNQQGNIERREGWYVKLPTYKDAYDKGNESWEAEKGQGPRPLGAWWLKFKYMPRKGIETRVEKV